MEWQLSTAFRASARLATAPLLEVGLNQALHIRETRLRRDADACRLVYVSDIHLRRGRSEKLCRQVLASVTTCNPDAILLGGDLVDQANELSTLSDLVADLQRLAPILAVGGNHDQEVGINGVRDAVIRGAGQWIHDATTVVTSRDRTIAISGPGASGHVDADVRVLCAHNPRIWKASRHAGYDLILAGHLHGCQFVAFEYRDRLFPGALFYPYCFLSRRSGSASLVVSRGVSDRVPIRWRCPREVVLCHV